MIAYTLLLIALAIIPAIILVYYVARYDKVEKEPKKLLFTLFCFGALSTLPASILESLLSLLLTPFMPEGSILYSIIEGFIIAGLVEESCKYYFLKKRTWNYPNFDFKFDAVLYAVCISLGFAALENIFYVFENGFSIVLPRALLSIPGHCCFAVLMGHYYGKEKLFESKPSAKSYHKKAILLPMCLHGIFDSLLMIGSGFTLLLYALYIVVLYICTFRMVKKDSREDQQIIHYDNV